MLHPAIIDFDAPDLDRKRINAAAVPCPACQSNQTGVQQTYQHKSGLLTSRIRFCQECGCRFRTRETIVSGTGYLNLKGAFQDD